MMMTRRSCRSRPASAGVMHSKGLMDDKVESMIQAAHEHFIETTNGQENEQEACTIESSQTKLIDHMDSFPLVPLPIIPLLDSRDLEKLEQGLRNLLESLTSHEDKQLGNYATRQLALIQQHLMHYRAQERVIQLLRGDVSVTLAPIKTKTLKKSSSSTAVTTTPIPSRICNEKKAVPFKWKSKKAAIDMARNMVQANAQKNKVCLLPKGFMISAGEKVSKKRSRPRIKKRSPEEETRDRAEQIKRNREIRRIAACQRLQARRELQAKRKQAHKLKIQRTSEKDERLMIKDVASSDSCDESEESDVSNCSESDEANEKAILALDVRVSSIEEVEDNDFSDSDGENVTIDERMVKHDETNSNQSPITDDEPKKLVILTDSIDAAEDEKVRDDTSTWNEKEENQLQDTQNDSFASDLERFMTNRAAAKLQQLQVEKEAYSANSISTMKHDFEAESQDCKEKNEAQQSVKMEFPGTHLGLPRLPVLACNDYRFYFRNFYCILTSVYEQMRSSLSTCSSSSSLYHRPIGATGYHTMRLQRKLYESWQSIMYDYTTVFGPKIVIPDGIVPMAAAKPWIPHYRINSTARKEVSEIVMQALHHLDDRWEDHPAGLGLKTTWNLLWTWSKPRVERQTLLVWQKVNHFQHAKALTRKDCLKKLLGKYQGTGGRLQEIFDIIPRTFLLPKEYVTFVHAFQERSEGLRHRNISEEKNIWIMKPVALSRGRGISLINDLSQLIYGDQVVIQEYIAAPRLLNGYKFDLRLYVLVTSFNPLEAFIYDEGFVRLCTRPYEDSDISNIFVHLTNSSIQKKNENFTTDSANVKEVKQTWQNEGDFTAADSGGTKLSLAYLWKRLAAEGVDVVEVKRNIDEVVLKALICGEDEIPFQVNSFDLFGYDILLDSDLRPWLIEINSSPSMARENDLDMQIKNALMLDALGIVDPLHFDRAKLAEVIARRQHDEEDEKKRPHVYTRHPRETEELAARQLNEDLTAILRGKLPRAYGEMPQHLGKFRRLCPYTNMYNQLVKFKRSYTRKV
ncbi:putative tubulin-tyrosine ligase/Tubulin polyglutamylase, ATP-grasp, subdomain 1 [Plasmopara halstedii]